MFIGVAVEKCQRCLCPVPLAFAQRQIRIKYVQKLRKQQRSKSLPVSIKTVGDWIQVKRQEKNLSPCHLAAKMGVATALICSWENGTAQPDNRQLELIKQAIQCAKSLHQTD
jgi:DNA-binding transcriptional regulator YiaG